MKTKTFLITLISLFIFISCTKIKSENSVELVEDSFSVIENMESEKSVPITKTEIVENIPKIENQEKNFDDTLLSAEKEQISQNIITNSKKEKSEEIQLHPESYYDGIINRDNVAVRKGLFLTDENECILNKGDKVHLISRTEQKSYISFEYEYWFFVELPNGNKGWVFGYFIDSEIKDSVKSEYYEIAEVNKENNNSKINYKDFFSILFIKSLEAELGYPPIKEMKGEFIITDNNLLSDILGGKILIGMNKSDLIPLIGKPTKKIDINCFEYSPEAIKDDCYYFYQAGLFYFSDNNILESIKIISKSF